MPSPQASRRNLSKYWRRQGRPRSADETLIIKQLLWQWWGTPEKERPSLRGFARQLGVDHAHLSRLWRKMLREGVPASFYDAPVTLADLEEAREVWKRVKARMAEDRLWEQYDAEQRRLAREQEGTYYEDESDDREESE